MRKLAKTLVLTAAVAATTFVPVLEASAGERWREHRPRHPEKHGFHGRDQQKADMLAAGILGLAVGALVVGAAGASSPPSYVHDEYDYDGYGDYDDEPEPVYARPLPRRDHLAPRGYHQPRVIYAGDLGAPEPWTAEWRRYCEQRYRSFNAITGTYRGYDGKDHFCVPK